MDVTNDKEVTPTLLRAFVSALCAALLPTPLAAQGVLREGFEGPEASWRFLDADTSYRVESQLRLQGRAHSGDWCEALRVAAGNGSYVYFAVATTPATVIDELEASLWVKSDRAGPQLAARVVLPRTVDPQTDKPLSVLVRGSIYHQIGQWEELRLPPLAREVEREARVLRERYKNVDTREAYLDAVALNVYAGPGRSQLLIDDLEIKGIVGGVERGPQNEGPQPTRGQTATPAKLQGSQLLVNGRLAFPRVIRHQGEPLAFLQRLGFNAVQLPAPATPELLSEATQAGIAVICPPPAWEDAAAQADTLSRQWDGVLAWDLGSGLTSQHFEAMRESAEMLRRRDSQSQRPLLCDALTDLRAFSRHADLLYPHRSPLGTSLELLDYGAWLRGRAQLARSGTPAWSVIQTQSSRSIQQQARAAGLPAVPDAVQDEQLRLLTYTALMAGARGLIFDSQSRLDQDDAVTRYRAGALQLVNLELSLLEPWLTTGSVAGAVLSSQSEISGIVLQTNRSRLLLLGWYSSGTQYAAGDSAARSASFLVPGVPENYDVYEITPVGLQSIPNTKRATGGVRITLAEFDVAAAIVFAEDALTIGESSKRALQTARLGAELQQKVVQNKLAIAEQLELTLAKLGQSAGTPRNGIVSAAADLRQCEALMKAGRYEAARTQARRAARPLRQFERAVWETAARTEGTSPASPLLAGPLSLPAYWTARRQLQGYDTSANQLSGGDCEHLQRMVASGWRHFRHAEPQLESSAEIAPGGAHTGQSALRLRVAATDAENPPELVESPPLWITTAAVPLRRGQWVRLHGWVRVPAPITGSVDGLLLFDSLGGIDLAKRIDATEGWSEFTIYRVAPQDGAVWLTCAMTGMGEAWLDDVTIEPLIQRTEVSRLTGGRNQP